MRIQFLFLLMAYPLLATDYYVRTDGNDSNDGLANTVDGAWRTVGHAAGIINADDTVYVQTGNYDESVTINHSDGSAGHYKRFLGVGFPRMTKITIQDNYCWISGFYIYSLITNSTVGISVATSSDHSVISNCLFYVSGTAIQGVTSGQADDVTISKNLITNCQHGIYVIGLMGGTGWLVESNTIYKLRTCLTTEETDYMRCSCGGNHRFIGNLCYGTTTNDVDTTIENHMDSLQFFDRDATHGSMTNILIAWNFFLDSINGIMASDAYSLGTGDFTVTNNVIGRGVYYYFTGEPNGQSPFNWNYSGALRIGTNIVKNNTWFDYGSSAVFAFSSNLVFNNNISIDSQNGYSFSSETAVFADYNCTHPNSSPDAGPHDITSDPLLINVDDPLGQDGIPWTSDDGLKLTEYSPARKSASDGRDMGAYQYDSKKMHAVTSRVKTLRIQ